MDKKKCSDRMGVPKRYFWTRLEIDHPIAYEVVWSVILGMNMASLILSVIAIVLRLLSI